MRIVYVLASLGVGGAERQALAIADRMVERGHQVALLVLVPPLAEEWPTTLDTLRLDIRKTPLSVVRGLLKARRFLHGFQPDLLHSHSFHANIVARLLKILLPSTKVLSTVHNIHESGRHRLLAYHLTDNLSLRTVAVSQAAADYVVRLKAVPERKCIVIPNGIDSAEFTPDAERRGRTRHEMGVNGSFVWLAAGRMVPAKDFPNLLLAFAQVRVPFPDAQLWIVGAPPGTALKKAERLGNGLNPTPKFAASSEQVRWLGLRRDMPALLDAADAFVLSSIWEGMPLAVGEAMAMEKPVVGTDAGGTRELVGDAGIVVPVRNATALARAMIELMQQPQHARRTLGQSGRARIVSSFNLQSRAGEWEDLYRAIVRIC